MFVSLDFVRQLLFAGFLLFRCCFVCARQSHSVTRAVHGLKAAFLPPAGRPRVIVPCVRDCSGGLCKSSHPQPLPHSSTLTRTVSEFLSFDTSLHFGKGHSQRAPGRERCLSQNLRAARRRNASPPHALHSLSTGVETQRPLQTPLRSESTPGRVLVPFSSF